MTQDKTQETVGDIRNAVRERYGKIVTEQQSCCGPTSADASGCGCGPTDENAFHLVSKLYQAEDVADLPTDVTDISLGCGDPVTLAALQPGQTVLDLGSGGGIDCFLAAKQVGPEGRVIGVDMTAEMLEHARANKAKIGADNVEFRLGEIEHLPISDESVDVIISNCVINLSPDKPQVFREAFRALKSGGKLSVSDIVTDGALPEEIQNSLSAWAGCVAGALDANDYIAAIKAAGFVDITLTPEYMDRETIVGAVEQLELSEQVDTEDEKLQQMIYSAKVTAYKP